MGDQFAVMGEKIGSGGEAVIYAVQLPGTQETHAMKMLLRAGSTEASTLRTIASFPGPKKGLLIPTGSGTLNGNPVIVMRRYERTLTDILPLVLSMREKNPGEHTRYTFILFACIVATLNSLKTMKIVHGDLKPGNFLLDSDPASMVLTDFGIARSYEKFFLTKGDQGTPTHMPPESVCRNPSDMRYPAEADTWSAGAMLIQLLNPEHPAIKKSLNSDNLMAILLDKKNMLEAAKKAHTPSDIFSHDEYVQKLVRTTQPITELLTLIATWMIAVLPINRPTTKTLETFVSIIAAKINGQIPPIRSLCESPEPRYSELLAARLAKKTKETKETKKEVKPEESLPKRPNFRDIFKAVPPDLIEILAAPNPLLAPTKLSTEIEYSLNPGSTVLITGYRPF